MGFLNRRKKPPERTPGGSEIIRSTSKQPQEMFGFTEQDTSPYCELRERVYADLIGPYDTVSHEIMPMVPHIDVYIHPPTDKRPFYTLASGGMSDLPMQIPPHVDRSYARREIILYCETPEEDYINMVRYFARFPFRYSTWLGHGHTIPNGDPPAPIFEDSAMVAVILLATIVHPDNQLATYVTFEGDPVEFLWPVPITQAEVSYKLEHGTNSLLDKFDQYNHPIVLRRTRQSYC